MKSVLTLAVSIFFPSLLLAQNNQAKLVDFRVQSVLSTQENRNLSTEFGQFLRGDQESVVGQNTVYKIESQIQNGLIRHIKTNTAPLVKHLDTLNLADVQNFDFKPMWMDLFAKRTEHKADFMAACDATISKPTAAGQELGFEMSRYQPMSTKDIKGSAEGLTDLLIAAFMNAHQNKIDVAGRMITIFNVIDYDPVTGAKVENPVAGPGFQLPFNVVRKVRTCLDVPFVEARCLTLKYKKVRLSQNTNAVLFSVGRTNGPKDPTAFWSNMKLNRVTEGAGLVVIKAEKENVFYKATFSGSLESQQLPKDMVKYDPVFAQFFNDPRQLVFDLGCMYLDMFKIFPDLPTSGAGTEFVGTIQNLVKERYTRLEKQCTAQVDSAMEAKANLIRPLVEEMKKEIPKIRLFVIDRAKADLEKVNRGGPEVAQFGNANDLANYKKLLANYIKALEANTADMPNYEVIAKSCEQGQNLECLRLAEAVVSVNDSFRAQMQIPPTQDLLKCNGAGLRERILLLNSL